MDVSNVKLKISPDALKGLENFMQVQTTGLAFLIGATYESMIECVGFITCGTDVMDDLVQMFQEITCMLPSGLDIVGGASSEPLPDELAQAFCEAMLAAEDSLIHAATEDDDWFIMCQPNEEGSECIPGSCRQKIKYTVYSKLDKSFNPCQLGNPKSRKLLDTVTVELVADLPLELHYNPSSTISTEQISEALVSLLEVVSSDCAAFQLPETMDLLHEEQLSGDKRTCKNLLQDAIKLEQSSKDQNHVKLELLLKSTGSEAEKLTSSCLPVIYYQRKIYQNATIPLHLSTLAFIPQSLPLVDLPCVLRTAISRQLLAMLRCITNYTKGSEPCIPQAFHFKPSCLEHTITAIYPAGFGEDDLKSQRQRIHKILNLPEDGPMIRRSNCVTFKPVQPSGDTTHLTNVHVGVKPSGIKDGEVAIVQGTYTYHHYMQDDFDDDGWGCAYRSLQTLVSWFRHQGFSSQPIPTHKEIQQALVDIGDKPPSFVGSKKWIGAMEVSFCMEKLIGIQCRILSVSSGKDIQYHAQDLLHHFRTQGTPIMIGGGVFAHTIIGVDYIDTTGDIRFLILDPHYTGSDDLKTIQSKGWCGWKGMNFWDSKAFYNLCMPKKPKDI